MALDALSRFLRTAVHTHLCRSLIAPARSLPGHEDQFRLPSLNGGCRLGEATFAGMGGKEEDALKPDLL
jgi:hypothetical protein